MISVRDRIVPAPRTMAVLAIMTAAFVFGSAATGLRQGVLIYMIAVYVMQVTIVQVVCVVVVFNRFMTACASVLVFMFLVHIATHG